MENLLRQLERQEGLMSHIQKALGEYLEGQRQVTLASISSAQVPTLKTPFDITLLGYGGLANLVSSIFRTMAVSSCGFRSWFV